MLLERGNGPWRQLQEALGRLALGLLDEDATLRIDGQTALDLECGHLGFEIEILFHEPEDLATAHARRECQDIESLKPIAPGSMKKICGLASVQGPDLRHVWLGSLCKRGHIAPE
jgi:alpha-D-ribose 1-methylphosphonate 5-triphosphate synthase subunit PhnH